MQDRQRFQDGRDSSAFPGSCSVMRTAQRGQQPWLQQGIGMQRGSRGWVPACFHDPVGPESVYICLLAVRAQPGRGSLGAQEGREEGDEWMEQAAIAGLQLALEGAAAGLDEGEAIHGVHMELQPGAGRKKIGWEATSTAERPSGTAGSLKDCPGDQLPALMCAWPACRKSDLVLTAC